MANETTESTKEPKTELKRTYFTLALAALAIVAATVLAALGKLTPELVAILLGATGADAWVGSAYTKARREVKIARAENGGGTRYTAVD